MEKHEVTIKDAFFSGFCFGMGLGLALIVYGLLSLAAVRMFVLPAGGVRSRQVRYYVPTTPQYHSRGVVMYDRQRRELEADPAETHEQTLERIEQERRELEAHLVGQFGPNQVDITAEVNK